MENSDKPVIVQKSSLKIVMESGTYWWCSCGRSKNQPFCDGSHKGTVFTPHKVIVEETELVKWCLCRHSEEGHICDNKHRELP